jgi:hypothetical protein
MPWGITGIPCSLGEINTGTCPSRLGGVSKIETIKYAHESHWDSDLRKAVLVMPNKNLKLQTRLLVREGPHINQPATVYK